MTRTRSRSALWGTVATGAVLALGLTACGGPSAPQPGDATSSSASSIPDTSALLDAVQVDDTLAAEVPADIKDAGTLVVGSNVQSAPNNFYAADGSTVVGSDHDLITAVAKKLGLDVEYQNQDFG